MFFIRRIIGVAIVLALSTGCYSTKMMEFTYQELDTLKTTQQDLLEKLDEMSRLYEEERAARVRAQADHELALMELRDAMEILASRFSDSEQLFTRPPVRRPTRMDTSSADTTAGLINPEAEKLYQASYMDWTLGNYDLALQGFKNYLVRYPEASNSPNAHYYLGESYYSLSRYLEAVAEFQVVIKEFPHSRLVPSSFLKSGFCYKELQEVQLAERAFRELIASYPRSEEAETAKVELENLGG